MMTEMLEEADDQATFSKVGALPAELRESIYKLYLSSLKTEGFPSQPPISKVSRPIRKESLPLFYRICRFTYNVRNTNGLSDRIQTRFQLQLGGQDTNRISKRVQDPFGLDSQDTLFHLQHLELEGTISGHGRSYAGIWRFGGDTFTCTFKIDRAGRVAADYIVRVPPHKKKLVHKVVEDRRAVLETTYTKREEKLAVMAGDAELFRKCFEPFGED